MDGIWTEVVDRGDHGVIVGFLIIVVLIRMVIQAAKRESLRVSILLCCILALLGVIGVTRVVLVLSVFTFAIGISILELVREWKAGPGIKWTSLSLTLFWIVWAFFFWPSQRPPERVVVAGNALIHNSPGQRARIERDGMTITLLADRYRSNQTWVIRSKDPTVAQIRLDDWSEFRNSDGDELTGAELALRIADWAGVKPLIKYDPLSEEQGPPGFRLTTRR